MYIKLRVITNTKTESIEKKSDDIYILKIREKAERNMANDRILEIFRKLFPKKSVKLISGHTSPSKILSID